MLYFTADPRNGASVGGDTCNTCCCEALSMRPGETNLVQINYAPWVLPIAPPGLIAATEYYVDHDESACSQASIDGFAPPANTNYELVTPVNTVLAIDLSTNEAPAGNTFSYSLVPLSGPSNGTIVNTGTPNGPTFDYTPNGGFTGYDYFAYKMTDAQGRSVTRFVQISVGTHFALPNTGFMSLVPYIDMSKAKIDTRYHTLTFALTMPLSCRPCDNYRLTIQQPAQDCERNVYQNQMCFDMRCKNCG